MTNCNLIQIFLLTISISNIFLVHSGRNKHNNSKSTPSSEPSTSDYKSSISNGDLNKLMRDFPLFKEMSLREQKYYTSAGANLCPLPYDDKTVLNDKDIEEMEFFNPREARRPMTWTQQNEQIVIVPIGETIGKKLGDVIQPLIKNDPRAIQYYTYYLNTMESAGITIVDRFCLFSMEVIDRIDAMKETKPFTAEFTLYNVEVNYTDLIDLVKNFKSALKSMFNAFRRYYISTLPLDCIDSALKKFTSSLNTKNNPYKEKTDDFRKHLVECRTLYQLKKGYVVLNDDISWKWDINSVEVPPDNHMILVIQRDSNIQALNIFELHK